ncbi:type II toxin-antitoxin system HicB family antitoxin [Chryseobacterium sp. FH1]|uniref:type II toxin-antitoxin system HicB family antitoxin n=1 Tax=Chryseobacterium sp. FH1 TaxID=1233951 RepID=UPI000556F767|nr:type II toxin-antitoxin system HicB family antitoxin [Chryseobacterium sp. FH1]
MDIIKVILEKTNTGYSAYAPDEKGLVTAGNTFDEIKENFNEVIDLQAEYLEETNNKEDASRLKKAKLEFYLDVEQFFEHFSMINKTAFAHYIGMNDSQLRKISNNIVPLSSTKALQIQNGLHTLAKDLSSVHFA